jgi:UTP--glucose-1-phosphate uridylyltransferase
MITKAIIPAAGFGTRFLPATKAIPKEMIPVVDTPTIEYVVREAVESGIDDIVIVVSRGKRAIEEHFSRAFELEAALESRKKVHELDLVKAFSNVKLHFVWQHEQKGLGDAVLHGKAHVGNNPFAVLLGDTIMESFTPIPVTEQIIKEYGRNSATTVALQEVPLDMVSRYGIIDGSNIDESTVKIENLVEKPLSDEAPSRLAISSRYIFTPEIFSILESLAPSENGEIGLTEAIQIMTAREPVYGKIVEGRRHDIGNKLEFIKANVLLGLKRNDIAPALLDWLKDLPQN